MARKPKSPSRSASPPRRFDAFAEGITGIGAVQALRDIQKRDVNEEFPRQRASHLHERQVALERATKSSSSEAKTVPEIMEVEEAARAPPAPRSAASRAISCGSRTASRPPPSPCDSSRARPPKRPSSPRARRSAPASRATMLFDLHSEAQRYGYLGAGLSIQFKPFGRALTFDFDLAHTAMTDRPTGSDYAYLFTTGFDLYSDLLSAAVAGSS